MTNALDFFTPKDLFDFGSMPVFKSFFGDFVPTNFTNSPKVNVKETDKAYEIEIANPGFSKDETKIEIADGIINVSMTSESKEGENDKNHKYHVKQWSKSSYQESWNIPENVIEEQITAKNNDGVLTITLPKKEEEPKKEITRTIEIE
jgi:HSP20 family protein